MLLDHGLSVDRPLSVDVRVSMTYFTRGADDIVLRCVGQSKHDTDHVTCAGCNDTCLRRQIPSQYAYHSKSKRYTSTAISDVRTG